jgi:hypothetical protein
MNGELAQVQSSGSCGSSMLRFCNTCLDLKMLVTIDVDNKR